MTGDVSLCGMVGSQLPETQLRVVVLVDMVSGRSGRSFRGGGCEKAGKFTFAVVPGLG